MSSVTSFRSSLRAGVGDGLEVRGRTYSVGAVGDSHDDAGFKTREYTLGDDADFYLVIEGDLDGDDPARCRAVVTHEIRPTEVAVPRPTGRRQSLAAALSGSADPPAKILHHQRTYQLSRKIDAHYRSESRRERRTTWDYESGKRNLAIERWANGEIAAYEGERLPLEAIRVIRGYAASATAAENSTVGLLVGLGMMVIGLAMLLG